MLLENTNTKNALIWIKGEIESNHVVHITWFPSEANGQAHASIISSLKLWHDYSKFSLHLMDPSNFESSLHSFDKIFQLFSIYR